MRRFALVILVVFAAMSFSATAFADDWEKVGVIEGVKVFKKEVPDSDLLAFRGELVANIHIGKIMSVFVDPKSRKDWVANYVDHETLAHGKNFQTYWIHFHAPFPISDRDYVLHSVGRGDKKTGLFECEIESVTRDDVPEKDCCVRARVEKTFYRFQAVKGKQRTKMSVEVLMDPKGMIPDWAVNMVQKKWPSTTLNNLVREASRDGVAVDPRFADFHERPVRQQNTPELTSPD